MILAFCGFFWWTWVRCIQNKSVCRILLIAWVICLVFFWFGKNWECSFLGKPTTCYVYWDNVHLGYPASNKNVQVSFSEDSLGCIWLLAEIIRKLIKVRVFVGLAIIRNNCGGTLMFSCFLLNLIVQDVHLSIFYFSLKFRLNYIQKRIINLSL